MHFAFSSWVLQPSASVLSLATSTRGERQIDCGYESGTKDIMKDYNGTAGRI